MHAVTISRSAALMQNASDRASTAHTMGYYTSNHLYVKVVIDYGECEVWGGTWGQVSTRLELHRPK